MRTIPLLLALCLLSGCAGQVISRFEAGNAVIEAERRQVIDFLTDKVCHTPIEWLMQASNPNLAVAVVELCPNLKRFVTEMAPRVQASRVSLTPEQLERLLAASRGPAP